MKDVKKIIEENDDEVHNVCKKEPLSSIWAVATTSFIPQTIAHSIMIDYFLMKLCELWFV